MAGSIYIGAYWGPREEALATCAERLHDCVEKLVDMDGGVDQWYPKTAKRPSSSLKPIRRELDVMKGMLRAGRNRKDFGGEVIEDLGFRASMWSRAPEAGLSAHCGSFAAGLGNHVGLHIWLEGDGARWVRAQAREILRVLVEAWDPDWASVVSNELRDAQEQQAGELAVGWMTYVKGVDDALISSLPGTATVERWEPGAVVVLGEPMSDVDQHALLAVRRVLTEAAV